MLSQRVASRRLRRQSIIFGVLVALSIGMMGISNTAVARDFRGATQYAFKPITGTLNGLADAWGSIWTAIAEIDHLRSENERLRQENEALQNQLSRMPEIQQINNDWTRITETQRAIAYKTLPAAVLVRDTAGPTRTFIIDKGSHDGIKKNQIVVAAGGALVGKVEEAGPSTSLITLITDVNSIVMGKTVDPAGGQQTADGDVRGQVGGLLEMVNVDANQPLAKGQQVVTAGYATAAYRSIFPPALLIGQVVDVSRDANAVVQTAFLEPAVDFQHARYVLVITNYEGGFGVDQPSAAPSRSAVPAP